jgi:ubiquinone/menaquinone biosynthesis C-methylase UbiE
MKINKNSAGVKNQNTSWGNVSDWYNNTVEDADSYQQKVILPNLLRIVAPTKGAKILDVGCGTGVFARAFVEKGAEVVGVDNGLELLDIAEKKSNSLNIKYVLASAENLSKIKDGEFDVVTIVLAIQNMRNVYRFETGHFDLLQKTADHIEQNCQIP